MRGELGARREFPSLADLEATAAARLSPRVWAYVQGGAGEERTVLANHAAFARVALRPRVLVNVATISLTTRVLGRTIAAPFFVAPMAYQREVHPDGERGVARAAEQERVLSVWSTLSSDSLEQIATDQPSAPRWFQLYLQPTFEANRTLVERAERAGYSALVITVDCPVLGVRDRQAREGFAFDGTLPVGNGPEVVPPSRTPTREGEVYRLRADASATWDTVASVGSITKLPLIIKGVLTGEDGRRAVDHGARAVVVSNHGGRQLDGAPATLDVLPEVVKEIGGDVEVYLDGGVRRGSDVLVALARGAVAVGIGRPVLWALAVGGGSGVTQYFSDLKLELADVMALAGRRTVQEIDGTLLT